VKTLRRGVQRLATADRMSSTPDAERTTKLAIARSTSSLIGRC
jgi:hypothetical protein